MSLFQTNCLSNIYVLQCEPLLKFCHGSQRPGNKKPVKKLRMSEARRVCEFQVFCFQGVVGTIKISNRNESCNISNIFRDRKPPKICIIQHKPIFLHQILTSNSLLILGFFFSISSAMERI